MLVEWFNHPKYRTARERLISTLTSSNYRFRRSGPIVFLCGKFESSARDALARYLRGKIPNIYLFYAEHVWELIAAKLPLGALAMEADLARLSDLVIIIVESYGTSAELGAFSNSLELRPKLLAIIPSEYKPPQHSFIALGPIRWIEADSQFAPTIYVPLNKVLAAAPEVEDRISRIKTISRKVTDLLADPKYLFLFVADLISISYPVTIETVEAYCNSIIQLPGSPAIATSVATGKAVGILSAHEVNGATYYIPAKLDSAGKPHHHLHHATLPGLRAEHLTALQAIPDARDVMDKIRRQLAH